MTYNKTNNKVNTYGGLEIRRYKASGRRNDPIRTIFNSFSSWAET